MAHLRRRVVAVVPARQLKWAVGLAKAVPVALVALVAKAVPAASVVMAELAELAVVRGRLVLVGVSRVITAR